MLRKLAFLTAALAAGTASAAQILPSQSFTTDSNTAYTYTLAETQTGSFVLDFTFSFSGKVQNNDFLGVWFGNANNINEGYKGPNVGFKANCDEKAAAPMTCSCARSAPAATSSRTATWSKVRPTACSPTCTRALQTASTTASTCG